MLSKSNIMQRIEIHLDKVKDKRCKDKEREKKKNSLKNYEIQEMFFNDTHL